MSGIQPRFGNNSNPETSTGIQGQIDRLTAAKTAVADAIVAKGVTVPADAKLEDMAPLIAVISAAEGLAAVLDEQETKLEELLFTIGLKSAGEGAIIETWQLTLTDGAVIEKRVVVV